MTHEMSEERITVHIICAMLDGGPFVVEFLRSVQAQTHRAWRLWVRDDGSTDGSVGVVQELARDDDRITLLHIGGPKLGAAGAFGWLLERVPTDAAYVMCGDADDVWLPEKIELEMETMRAAERLSPGPVLVHTDLVVADAELSVIHPSFWRYSRIEPEPVSLRRIAIQNVTTGSTIMLNRELCELIGQTPPGARFQDWWYTLVAVAFGRVVALHEATVLYRQHGHNVVGARRRSDLTLADAPREIMSALSRTARLRDDLAFSCRQAEAFLSRYGDALDDGDRRFLESYSRIPTRGFVRRKFDVLRLRLLRGDGLLRNLGVLLRA